MLQFGGTSAFRPFSLILPFLMITYVQYELTFRRVRMVARSIYSLCPVRPSIHMYQHSSYLSEIWYIGGLLWKIVEYFQVSLKSNKNVTKLEHVITIFFIVAGDTNLPKNVETSCHQSVLNYMLSENAQRCIVVQQAVFFLYYRGWHVTSTIHTGYIVAFPP